MKKHSKNVIGKVFARHLALWIVFGFVMPLIPDLTTEAFGQNNPAAQVTPDVDVVWPEYSDNNFEIYYNSESKGVWQKKVRLTHNNVPDITPCVAAGLGGDTVVVWSVVHGMESQLKYSIYQNHQWSKPATIPSYLKSNLGPTVMIDDNHDVWVAWSGFDGQDDDIFFSVLRADRWDAPQRIHPDNSVPDVMPLIGMDDSGKPQVTWKGFDGDIYQNRQAVWDASGWTAGQERVSEVVSRQATDDIQTLSRRVERHLQDVMSSDVQNRRVSRRAGFHIRKRGRFQSIPLKITKSEN